MEFSCGSTAVVVQGSVLGREKADLSQVVMMFPGFLANHGAQREVKFEGLPKEKLKCGERECGLTLSMVQTNEEKMEINSIF